MSAATVPSEQRQVAAPLMAPQYPQALRTCLPCLQARSLLTAHEDFTTLQFHAGTEIQRPGFVFSALKQRLEEAKVEEIKRICLTVDQKSAIFDVPSQYVKVTLLLHHCVLCMVV